MNKDQVAEELRCALVKERVGKEIYKLMKPSNFKSSPVYNVFSRVTFANEKDLLIYEVAQVKYSYYYCDLCGTVLEICQKNDGNWRMDRHECYRTYLTSLRTSAMYAEATQTVDPQQLLPLQPSKIPSTSQAAEVKPTVVPQQLLPLQPSQIPSTSSHQASQIANLSTKTDPKKKFRLSISLTELAEALASFSVVTATNGAVNVQDVEPILPAGPIVHKNDWDTFINKVQAGHSGLVGILSTKGAVEDSVSTENTTVVGNSEGEQNLNRDDKNKSLKKCICIAVLIGIFLV